MDFLISDGSERFLTKVGRFGSEFGSLRNPKKTAVRFGKHRKYCNKFQKTHIQIQTGGHAFKRCSILLSVLRSQNQC
jgi:hypothetical protein